MSLDAHQLEQLRLMLVYQPLTAREAADLVLLHGVELQVSSVDGRRWFPAFEELGTMRYYTGALDDDGQPHARELAGGSILHRWRLREGA